MGRHSDGKSNFSLSANAIVVLVIVIALIAGLIWWFGFRQPAGDDTTAVAGGQDNAECLEGELSLPLAAEDDVDGQRLLAAWQDTDPVVRDHCVQPELVDDPAEAAAYIGTWPAYEAAGRSAAGSATVVDSLPVGVVATGDVDVSELAADELAYPVADHPAVAAAVAAELTADDDAAAALLDRDAELTLAQAQATGLYAAPQTATGEDATFTELGSLAVEAVALTPAGEVSEEQSRAAAEFVDYSAEQHSPTGDVLAVEKRLLAQATGEVDAQEDTTPQESTAEESTAEESTAQETTPTEEPAPAPATPQPVTTLLLLDTSERITGRFDAVRDELAGVAAGLTDQGNAVAIWNYSSPINPGVQKGWRRNLTFTDDADAVANVLRQLGTGGVPQTRSAVVAAANTAADQARLADEPVRVLVVTTGTEVDLSDEDFRQALGRAQSENVMIDVIHVGDAPVDQALADVADSSTTGIGSLRGAAGL